MMHLRRLELGALVVTTMLTGCDAIWGLQRASVYVEPDAGGTGGMGGAAPTCTDGTKNGTETGKDCGGGACLACPVGEGCVVGTDCESLACSPVHICVPSACNDTVQNASESDIDCGGVDCPPCALGLKCNQDADCVSHTCTAGVCEGECVPEEKRCMGNTPQTCDATWHWQSGVCGAAAPQCCHGDCLALAVEVAAGSSSSHTCVRQTDGSLWCWGNNSAGQLGDGTMQDKSSPVQVTALGMDVAEVAAGLDHTCARKTDGTLWCWGGNSAGQLGDGTMNDRSSPVQVVKLGTEVAEVVASASHTCARKTDGSLWCWGSNSAGKLGDGTTVGKLTPTQIASLGTSVAQIAASAYHTCARKTDGSLWCWGLNLYGQLGDGTTANKPSPTQVTSLGTNVAEVAVGTSHTCARQTDGSLWCWGLNSDGQLGDGTTDGKSSPVLIMSLAPTTAEIAAGAYHTCARQADGSLWCWGLNADGQLGDGTTNSKPSPTGLPALNANVAEVVGGADHTCARKTDGTLWCWGNNDAGQLGDGTLASPSTSPKRLSLGACE
jgi:alpha-tubulin suppressor-like RCC1 family protein